jgi:hypothetical protein
MSDQSLKKLALLVNSCDLKSPRHDYDGPMDILSNYNILMFRCDSIEHDYETSKAAYFSPGYKLIKKYEKTVDGLPYTDEIKLAIKKGIRESTAIYDSAVCRADSII